MSDCLITKLKSSVSDDLMRLGEIRLEIESAQEGGYIQLYNEAPIPVSEDIIIKVVSGNLTFKPGFDTTITSYVTEYTGKGNGYRHGRLYLTGSGVISITSMYWIAPTVFSKVKVIGDSSIWKYCRKDKLKYVEISSNEKFTIRIEDLKEFHDLTAVLCSSATAPYTNIMGDASLLPAKVTRISNSNQKLTWQNNRNSSYPVIAAEWVNFGEYLDAYLINQANCVVSDNTSIEIKVFGTKTSASNAAVTSLKNMGYSIQINGVKQ